LSGTGGVFRARVIRHGVIDSTSEAAFRDLERGLARHGDVHVAHGQTAGRGRRGRRWQSAAGEGLYLSAVLLPLVPLEHPVRLTMSAALALRDALAAVGLPGTRLEWPNDVVSRGAKLAGILVETRGVPEGRPHWVVGVGVNVRQRSFPAELLRERPVTSLALEGVELGPDELLPELLAALERRWSPPELAVEGEFLEATGLAGRRVRVERGTAAAEGRLEALDEKGLRLRQASGAEIRIALAQVSALEPLEPPL
jgi:BirA family biotin operon repressor/biotin-[acetyl-CoA-carboxylase] ligase